VDLWSFSAGFCQCSAVEYTTIKLNFSSKVQTTMMSPSIGSLKNGYPVLHVQFYLLALQQCILFVFTHIAINITVIVTLSCAYRQKSFCNVAIESHSTFAQSFLKHFYRNRINFVLTPKRMSPLFVDPQNPNFCCSLHRRRHCR